MDAEERFRSLLFFRFSSTPMPPIQELKLEIDTGLAEAGRLGIENQADIVVFLEAVYSRFGRFPRQANATVTYPRAAARFLEALEVPAGERVRRFAEWATLTGPS